MKILEGVFRLPMKEKSEKNSSPAHGNRIAFYHQNEALLLQFLLHESLRANQVLKKKPNPELFLQLTGNLNHYPSTWHAPFGHLPKLFHYCSLLSMHFNTPPSLLCAHLGESLERAFVLAKSCQALTDAEEEERGKLYSKLKKETRLFLKLLFEKVADFRDNPSVLFFLLKHQEEFDALFREPIIRKTFQAFFPEGMKHAYQFLVEKFSKKGFNHLLPLIEEKLKTFD